MIQVHHADEPTFGLNPQPVWPEGYSHVADVDVADEHYADVFRLTNHIERSWQENAAVTPVGEAVEGARSTSVGDIIVLADGKVLRCARVGWKEVSDAPTA